MLTVEEYKAKRLAKIERLRAAAKRVHAEGKASIEQGDSMFKVIPFGQPILVGHHSERRDRNYRDRAWNKLGKGYKLIEKSEKLNDRAAAIEQNRAIFSDDPEAIEKIGGKLAQLEARQERMKAANKLVKKGDRDGLTAMGYSETEISYLLDPKKFGGPGYASFELTNNNANIRRLKERAKVIEQKQAIPDKDEEHDGIRVEWRASENRIRVFYPGRVDLDTYKALKQHGFRVLRSEGEGAFSAYYNQNAAYFVKTYIRKQA